MFQNLKFAFIQIKANEYIKNIIVIKEIQKALPPYINLMIMLKILIN